MSVGGGMRGFWAKVVARTVGGRGKQDGVLPICDACWNKRHPDQPVDTIAQTHGAAEECQDCGALTSSGLTDVPWNR